MTHLIDDHWRDGQGLPFDSIDPASGEVLWRGRAATEPEVDAATTAARLAFEAWANCPLPQRIALCEAFGAQLEARREALATAIARETGKPRWEANGEVTAMVAKVAISVEAQGLRAADQVNPGAAVRSAVRHRPHGVLAILGPYNFPGHLPNGHIVPALLAGNTLVFKPSEYTPRVAELTVQCWQGAGLPPGVLNLIQGQRDTGAHLAAHPGIDGLLFTGSHRTGRDLHRLYAGQTGKLLALEMGGNNPLVAWEVDDVDAAAVVVIQSAFLSAGQRCSCARRLIVADDTTGQALVARVCQLAQALKVGPWDADPAPFMGPVIDNRAAQGILEVEALLVARGGQTLVAVERPEADKPFLTPGIVDVTDAAPAFDDEAFGPLLQVVRVADFEAAIDAANATRYGLAAGLLSADPRRWQRFFQASRAGVVNWNRPLTGASSKAPFGGIKDSGNLRPSAFYAADYCAYPVASQETDALVLPDPLPPGLAL